MDRFLTFLDMGGYALWVWPAYGAAVIGLVGILVLTLRSLKAREREFESLKAQRRGGEGA
jgi:heme exporter protein D